MDAIKIAAKTVLHVVNAAQDGADTLYHCGAPKEALADMLYDDTDFLCDLSGDYIYDQCKGDLELMCAVANELCKYGANWKTAGERMLDDWSERKNS